MNSDRNKGVPYHLGTSDPSSKVISDENQFLASDQKFIFNTIWASKLNKQASSLRQKVLKTSITFRINIIAILSTLWLSSSAGLWNFAACIAPRYPQCFIGQVLFYSLLLHNHYTSTREILNLVRKTWADWWYTGRSINK